MKKIPVAVLGATGSVGQRFVQLLEDHPWFEVVALTGSDRSVCQRYDRACHWILPEAMPPRLGAMTVLPTRPDEIGVPLVFSSLPADLAREVEPAFARSGAVVCSNASAFREEGDVPILLPEVNPGHIALLAVQQRERGWAGAIVTNPNCTSTGMTVALKALMDRFGLVRVFAFSMQAVSGAGYPGVASLDILDNAIPYIGGEEDKVETEPLKMLGRLEGHGIVPAPFAISAHANRVAVSDGHLVCLSVQLKSSATPEEAARALREYQAPEASRDLPSSPRPVLLVRDEPDRPQPRLDRQTGKGMTTVVGRIRQDPLLDLKLVVFSHNTVRGAAGGSIYNAELLVRQGMIVRREA